MSGGCGYVLSRAALDKFIEFLPNATQQECAAANSTEIEDVEMSRCLQNAGAVAGDSRDDEFKTRFLAFMPEKMLRSNSNDKDFWGFLSVFYHVHYVGLRRVFFF